MVVEGRHLGGCAVDRLSHVPAHLRHATIPIRLERETGAVLLGHSTPGFTMSVYVHLLADDLPTPTFNGYKMGTNQDETGRNGKAAEPTNMSELSGKAS